MQAELLFNDKPQSPPGSDPDGLRYYQRDAYNAVQRELAEHRATLVVMATGLGKTTLFGAVAKHWPGRVLVIAHREELVDQASQRLAAMTDEQIGVERAEFYSRGERIVVASVQTLHKDKRLMRYSSHGSPSLIIADEVHHAQARSWKKIINHWSTAKVLGVTATPDRGDKKPLGEMFQSVAYRLDINQGIEAGYLVPLVGERVYVDSLDISQVKSLAGDLAVGELDDAMAKAVEPICQALIQRWPTRRGIVFLPGKRSAKAAYERMEVLAPGISAVVTDETPAAERKEIIAGCKSGKLRYLLNCQVATEGFDWPAADVVVLARPTKSRALHTQMVGRGARVLPGIVEDIPGPAGAQERKVAVSFSSKPSCIIADFVGNCGKHSLVSLEDCLGGEYTADEVKRAKRIAEKKKGGDPLENLREAREALRRMAKAYTATMAWRIEHFDPFKSMGVNMASVAYMDGQMGFEPVTRNQAETLKKIGLTDKDLEHMSARAARRWLQNSFERRQKGMSSYKQMKVLGKRGIDGKNMTFAQASMALDFLAKSNWRASAEVVLEYLANNQSKVG